MQFVLDDQVRWWKTVNRQRMACNRLTGAVEAMSIITLHSPEETTDLAGPGHSGELVHRGNQEARESAIDRLIDRENG